MRKTHVIQFALFFMFFISCESNENEELNEQNNVIQSEKTDSVSLESDLADSSLITCPSCGYTTMEELPDEYCLLAYDCLSCGHTMHPAKGDCCVFCTHGTEKCPSIQEKEN